MDYPRATDNILKPFIVDINKATRFQLSLDGRESVKFTARVLLCARSHEHAPELVDDGEAVDISRRLS
jgi:hypothetical protein